LTGSIFLAIALSFVLLLPTSVLKAQNVSASLTGTVNDTSGAVIPKADVTLKNEASGDIRKTVSNTDGYFTFAAIPPGSYTVEVDVSGFEKWQATQIVLNAGDTRAVTGIVLQVGSSKETVSVEATGDTVTPVDSGDKSAVINQKIMTSVAIIGQNAAEFIKIMPGMAMTSGALNVSSYQATNEGTGNGPVANFSANGMRTAALDITADGAHIIDPGCNCGQSVNTNVDMTQELKVDMQSFGADSSKGPVVVNAIGKSGGARFHGEGFFYARDYVLNANDWRDNAAGVGIPQTSYFFPGGNIGGPVVFPHSGFNHNHDKLFFFFGIESYRQNVDNGLYQAVVPTGPMRTGDFSNADNPTMGSLNGYAITGQPNFPGGIVPAANISPYGTALLNVYPLPNANPASNDGFNYVSASTRYANMLQIRPRVDYSINDNTKLYVSWNRQRDNVQESLDTLWTGNAQSWVSPTVPYPTPILEKSQSDSISVSLTKVFGPTLTNEAIFTYTNLNLPNTLTDPSKAERGSLGLTYQMAFTHANEQNLIFPQMTGWSDGIANELQAGFELNGTVFAHKTLPNFADHLSKVWGTHTAKFGFYWERTWNEQPGDGDVNGQMAFANWGGNSTGNAYADMLAGDIASYSEQNFNTTPAFKYMSADFYAQDSWKVSRRLTVEYGLRVQHLGPWADLSGYGFAIFNPAAYVAPTAANPFPGFEWNKIDSSVPLSGSPSRMFFYNPRIGFAYDIFGSGKTVLRGGYGIYHYHDEQNVQNAAYSVTQGEFSASLGPATYLDLANASAGAAGSLDALDSKDSQQPRVQNYSVTVAQRLPWHSVLEAAYVGNKGDVLSNYNNSIGDLNLLSLGSLFSAYGWLPGGYSSGQENAIRTYPGYSQIKIITHDMYSNYNSLQVSWNKQSGRFNFLTNYTFSKALGIRGENGAAVGNPENIADDYGTLPNNRTHIINTAYTYQIPDPGSGNKLLKAVAGGWMISGITQVQSGADLQAAVAAGSNFNFSYYIPAGTTFMGTTTTSPTSASNAVLFGSSDIQMMPVVTCDPRQGLKANQYVNGNCFAGPAVGTNGNYIFPALTGPWFWESDISLFKTFTFKESQKFELRGSAYNFLNHPLNTFIANDPNLNLGFNQTGQLINQNFGVTTNKTDHRIMQLAVKYIF
jgi:hypothetical protein